MQRPGPVLAHRMVVLLGEVCLISAACCPGPLRMQDPLREFELSLPMNRMAVEVVIVGLARPRWVT